MQRYRNEIDGLRAVAIIPVVLFHIWPDIIPCGYIGVDIFFVISGFLITSIILNKINSNTFSLSEFYERRIKRILPLYFLTTAVTIPIGYFFLLPNELKDLSQSIVASVVFASNYFFYFEIDYFNPFAQKSPLLHTWSLSIEEQFYLIIPCSLLLINKSGKKWQLIFISSLGICSFIYCIIIYQNNESLAFYSILSRAWELLVGSVSSIIYTKNTNKIRSANIVDEILCITSFVCLILSMLWLHSHNHPSHFTLLPVLCTSILLLRIERTSFLIKFLSIKPLVNIGLISFSLYMIHYPLIAYFKIWKDNNNLSNINSIEGLILVILILLLGYFSYRYFEKPIRYSQLKRLNVFLFSAVAIMIFLSLGFYGHKSNGFIERFLDSNTASLFFEKEKEKKALDDFRKKITERHFKEGEKNILIIGDSFAGDLDLSLNSLNKDYNIKTLFIDDKVMDKFLLALIEKRYSYEAVLNKKTENMADIIELIDFEPDIFISAKWTEFTYLNGFKLGKYLKATTNSNVSIIGSVLFTDLSVISIDIGNKGIKSDSIGKYIFQKHVRRDRLKSSEKLKKLVLGSNLNWVDRFSFFCAEGGDSCELFYPNGKPMIWDNGHLSIHALSDYGRYVLEKSEGRSDD